MQTSQTKKRGFIPQDCNSRYILRQVNYSLFLYDRLEDIYIPVEVIPDIISGVSGQECSK